MPLLLVIILANTSRGAKGFKTDYRIKSRPRRKFLGYKDKVRIIEVVRRRKKLYH
jgi:hypothetical protein